MARRSTTSTARPTAWLPPESTGWPSGYVPARPTAQPRSAAPGLPPDHTTIPRKGKDMLSKKLTVALGTGIFALGAAGSAHAATITVNNNNSSGAGSLRSAIIAANGTPLVTDTIKFSIPGNALHTITPATALPPVTAPVKINGYTQTDAGPATDVSPATLKIAINAVNADE